MNDNDFNKLRTVIKEEVTSTVKKEVHLAVKKEVSIAVKKEVHLAVKKEVSIAVKKEVNLAIKAELEPVNEKLGRVEKKLDILWDQTAKLTVDLEEVKETLDSHTKVLNSHTDSLRRIETRVEYNSDDTARVNKRLITVENHLGIVPPPELTLIN